MGSGSDNRINNPPPPGVGAALPLPAAEVQKQAPAERIQPTTELNTDLPSNEHRALIDADVKTAGATPPAPESNGSTNPSGPLDVPSLTKALSGRRNRDTKTAVNVLLGVDITQTGVGGTVAPGRLGCEQTASEYWESFFTEHYGEVYSGKTGAERRDFQEAFFAANAFLAAKTSGALRGDHKTQTIMDYAIALAENPQAYGRLVMPGVANMQGLFHATRAEEIPESVRDEIVAAASARLPDTPEGNFKRMALPLIVGRGAQMMTERLRRKGESPQWNRLEARVASLGEVTGEEAPGRLNSIRPSTGETASVPDPEGDVLVEDLVAAVSAPPDAAPNKTPDGAEVVGNFAVNITGLGRDEKDQQEWVADAAKAAGFDNVADAYGYFKMDPENEKIIKLKQGFDAMAAADDLIEYDPVYEEGTGFSDVMDELEGADLSAIGRGEQKSADNAVADLREQQANSQVRTARIADETNERVREYAEAVDLGNEAVDEMSTAREIKRSNPDASVNPHPKSGT